jgi:hypothetical protein
VGNQRLQANGNSGGADGVGYTSLNASESVPANGVYGGYSQEYLRSPRYLAHVDSKGQEVE